MYFVRNYAINMCDSRKQVYIAVQCMRKLINIFSMQRDGFQPAQDRRKGIEALNVV